jgi:hypothetical protein
MKKLLLMTALTSVGFATQAFAGSTTIDGLTITQIAPEHPGTFDNNPLGATTGYSSVSDWAYHGSIAFSSDGGVQQGTSGSFAQPAGDTSHYLGGVNGAAAAFGPFYFGGLTGSVVMFTSYQPDSFNIYWGSIDALVNVPPPDARYDNTLVVYGDGDNNILGSITGSELVAAIGLSPAVFGQGDQFDANDNQWFNISAGQPILAFNAYSTNNAFEFDMGTPEPSTWAMMLLGFVGLGYAGFRRAAKSSVSIA